MKFKINYESVNWDKTCEESLNRQINLELWASHQYSYIASYLNNTRVSLPNISNFFRHASHEEKEHAEKLIDYQNKRGGTVVLTDITGASLEFLNNSQNEILTCFEKALEMERSVNKSLLNLTQLAQDKNDPQFVNFLQEEYLKEQVNAEEELSKYITELKRIGNDGVDIWNYDKIFYDNKKTD